MNGGRTIAMRIASGFAANIYGQSVTLITQLIGVPIYLTAWGLSGYGYWSVVASIPLMLNMLDLGFPAAAAASISRLVAKKKFRIAARMFSTMMAIVGGIAAIILSVGALIFAYTIDDIVDSFKDPTNFSSIYGSSIPFILIYAAFSLISSAVNAGYRATGNYARGITIYETGRLIEQGLTLLMVFLGGSIPLALATMCAIRALSTCVAAWHLRTCAPELLQPVAPSIAASRALFPAARSAFLVPLASIISIHGTTLIGAAILSPTMLGVIAASRVPFRAIVQVTSALTRAATPEFAFAWARRDQATVARLSSLVLVFSATVSASSAGLVVFLLPRILQHWTHGNVAAPAALAIGLCVHAVAGSIWLSLIGLPLSINRQRPITGPLTIFMFGALAISVPLYAWFGLTGVSISMALIESGALVVVLLRWPLPNRPTIRPALMMMPIAFGHLVRTKKAQHE